MSESKDSEMNVNIMKIWIRGAARNDFALWNGTGLLAPSKQIMSCCYVIVCVETESVIFVEPFFSLALHNFHSHVCFDERNHQLV